MTVREVIRILDAEVLVSGDLDTEVKTACGSDMMSDVLAFVKDQGMLLTGLCNPQVIAHLREAAKEGDVPYQDEVLTAGGTDSAAIQKTRGGVLSGCISIPCRYIHSQNEMVSLKDVEQSARLMALCAQRTL